MRIKWVAGAVAMVALLINAQRARGGTVLEIADAGDMPTTAQFALGIGQIDAITGTIGAANDADMFAIQISNPSAFSATTDVSGTIAWDTQLFLFNAFGMGVMANDDIANGNGPYNPRSVFPAGSPVSPVTAGVYFLAISGWDHDPHSDQGAIFTDDSYYAQTVGPVGPGGHRPVSGWDGDGALNGGTGAYRIALTGASFLSSASPEPGGLVMGLAAVLIGLGARMRFMRS